MIKLSDGCYVAASEIAEVRVNQYSDFITVRMKNGIGHSLGADYGKGIYETMDKLIAQIDAEMSKNS